MVYFVKLVTPTARRGNNTLTQGGAGEWHKGVKGKKGQEREGEEKEMIGTLGEGEWTLGKDRFLERDTGKLYYGKEKEDQGIKG